MRSDRGRWPYAPDAAIAAVIAAALVASAVPVAGSAAGAYVAVAVGAVGMACCRRFPVPALVVVAVSMLGYVVVVEPIPAAAFGVLGAVFVAARAGHRLVAVVVSVLFLAGFFATDLTVLAGYSTREVLERTLLLMGWFVAANVLGLVSRQRRAYLAAVEQRAADAERTREEVALRRAGEERLRIARELHDSLTHSISIVKLQAGVAVHLARKRGEAEPEALLAIQQASGDAMRELRSTLEVLRSDNGEDPAAGISRLGDLLARTRSAGLVANLTTTGSRAALPTAIDKATYRIVQEALTNVVRHAGASTVSVHLRRGPRGLSILVDDDGSGHVGSAATGTGLAGMRERVAVLGGWLYAGPGAADGFHVHAEIPWHTAERARTPPSAMRQWSDR